MLTVLMPTRNSAENLSRTLESCTHLEAPEGGWKLVVVDNGSTDYSLDLIDSYKERLPLIATSFDQAGKNRALNSVLHLIEGDLVLLTDDDIIPDRDWLTGFRSLANDCPDYSVFAGRTLPAFEEQPPDWMKEWNVPIDVMYGDAEEFEDGPCGATYPTGANMAIRAEIFTDKGYRFNENIGPDGTPTFAMGSEKELSLRLERDGYKFWRSNRPKLKHWVPAKTYDPKWICSRAYRYGKGNRVMGREISGRNRIFFAHIRNIFYTGLSFLPIQILSKKLDFQATYNRYYWRGYLDG